MLAMDYLYFYELYSSILNCPSVTLLCKQRIRKF